MTDAKTAILARIRETLAGSPPLEYEGIHRDYGQAGTLDQEARLDLFEDRLVDYGSVVYRCTEGQVRETIAAALLNAGKRFLVVPRSFPDSWLPEGVDFRRDAELSYSDLNKSEGVLTACAVAIAETGTIILRHSEQHGRRALTLIPDYHLCIVRASQLAETVVEGWRLTALFAAEPITTISGPSATSDIEMTRVKGVHGPRTLDVILLV